MRFVDVHVNVSVMVNLPLGAKTVFTSLICLHVLHLGRLHGWFDPVEVWLVDVTNML